MIRDLETGELLTLAELRIEYQKLAEQGETEAACFADYLENITDRNGTCEWVKE